MMVNTIYGEMDEELLENRTGSSENEDEIVNWNEYWLNDELVHRSVHVHLKRGIDFGAEAASIV